MVRALEGGLYMLAYLQRIFSTGELKSLRIENKRIERALHSCQCEILRLNTQLLETQTELDGFKIQAKANRNAHVKN